MSTFNQLFKEYFYVGSLSEKEQKLYNLIERYRGKVSKRLLNTQKDLFENGSIKFGENLKALIDTPSPFLEMIKKAQQSGNLYHQPVILSLEHGITFMESEDK